MKTKIYEQFKALFLGGLMSAVIISSTSCGGDDKDPDPVFADPQISLTASGLDQDSVRAEVTTVIEFTVSVEAEAGISRISLNGSSIETFDGTTTSEEFVHEYTVPDQEEAVTLTFSVTDIQGTSIEATKIVVVPEIPITSLTIMDLMGTSSGDATWLAVESWDRRVRQPFNVTGDFTSEASIEVLMQQATFTFAASAPGDVKALELVKQTPDSITDDWGGWPEILFSLGTNLPQEEMEAIPVSDGSGELTTGTRVITMEVYWDDTVDPDFSWSDLIAQDAPWNSTPSNGYKLDFSLLNYNKESYAQSFYVRYSEYLTEPNKWQTITFDTKDKERFGDSGSTTADMVNAIWLAPTPGYDQSKNKLYIRNLKIVDVE